MNIQKDKPVFLKIKEIINETPRVKTFIFEEKFAGLPGQFVMVWLPGYDEKPFGVIQKDEVGTMISVAKVGDMTQAMHALKKGDEMGIRGPYGSYFHVPPHAKVIALVAGGYGMAPLSYLAQEARKKNISVHLFIGARTKNELLYRGWMQEIGVKLHISTDDGSEGFHGFNTVLFESEVNGVKPNKVFTVGPEIMEKKIADICFSHKTPFEVSLERYMKCAIGICGQCSVDPTGWRMCVEGPVIDGKILKKISEFGKYRRSASGKILPY